MLGWFCTLSEPSSCALNSSRGACLQEFSCLCLKWVLASIISPHQMVLCRWLAALICHQCTPLPGSIPSSSLLGGEGQEAPRMGEMSQRGQLQHLRLFHTKKSGGGKVLCVYCRLRLPVSLILGNEEFPSSIHSLGSIFRPWLCPWFWKALVLASGLFLSALKAQNHSTCVLRPPRLLCLNLFWDS